MGGVIRDPTRADRLRSELLGRRRYEELGLDDVVEIGRVLFGDPAGLSFYRLAPQQWYRRGVRLLGRTCVEATPDRTAGPIAGTVRELLAGADAVVDLFAGSGNLMLHVAAALAAPAVGIEADPAVWARTDANLRLVDAGRAGVRHGDWLSYFDDQVTGDTAVYVVSPPWGDAFSFAAGLDLARTHPPVPRILDTIAHRDRSRRCFAVIQRTPVEPVRNVAAVTDRYPLAGAGAGCLVVRVRGDGPACVGPQ